MSPCPSVSLSNLLKMEFKIVLHLKKIGFTDRNHRQTLVDQVQDSAELFPERESFWMSWMLGQRISPAHINPSNQVWLFKCTTHYEAQELHLWQGIRRNFTLLLPEHSRLRSLLLHLHTDDWIHNQSSRERVHPGHSFYFEKQKIKVFVIWERKK